VGGADQGEWHIGRLTWFETAAQIYLGESFTMICVDARHADNGHIITSDAKPIQVAQTTQRSTALWCQNPSGRDLGHGSEAFPARVY